jgi:hypothetical protein
MRAFVEVGQPEMTAWAASLLSEWWGARSESGQVSVIRDSWKQANQINLCGSRYATLLSTWT